MENKIDEPQWLELKVKIVFDPNYIETNQNNQEFTSLQLDKLTWMTLINNAVSKLYGLVGESLFYEVQDLIDHGKQCSIKIMADDEKTFINSLFTYKFKFNTIYGGNITSDCYISHIKTIKVKLAPDTAN